MPTAARQCLHPHPHMQLEESHHRQVSSLSYFTVKTEGTEFSPLSAQTWTKVVYTHLFSSRLWEGYSRTIPLPGLFISVPLGLTRTNASSHGLFPSLSILKPLPGLTRSLCAGSSLSHVKEVCKAVLPTTPHYPSVLVHRGHSLKRSNIKTCSNPCQPREWTTVWDVVCQPLPET